VAFAVLAGVTGVLAFRRDNRRGARR
jgi:hypothetical protein